MGEGNTAMEGRLKDIWTLRREVEAKSGKALTIYSAYPSIGRGSVKHNTLSHAEVMRRFEKALCTK